MKEDILWNWIYCRIGASTQDTVSFREGHTQCHSSHMTSLSHPEAISSSCASLYSHLEKDGIYWEHTYGNTFRESVSMKSIISQVASDVAVCLRLAKIKLKKKKKRGKKRRKIPPFQSLFQFRWGAEGGGEGKLKSTNDLWLPKQGVTK